MFAVALWGILMNADDTTIITLKPLKQSGLEGPSCHRAIPAIFGEDSFTALMVARDGVCPGVCQEMVS